VRRLRISQLALVTTAAISLPLIVGLILGGPHALQASPRQWGAALRNFVQAQLTATPVDSLRIDIKFKHLHRLHTKRDAALADGMLITEESDFVAGSIALADASVPIELRLIGPDPRHLTGSLWSMEIQVQGDAHINGMRRFALFAPQAVGAPIPLLAARQLSEAGLAAPRTDLVEVAINGDPLGLAALIELPSPELLESSGRNAAPVVSFDTSAYWKALRDNGRTGPFDNPYTAAITAAPNPEDRDARTAVALLRGFLRGDLPANEVFDVPATARWLAYAELWGDASSVHWTRARFYLDGLTARLAPIPALPRTVLAVGEVPDPATGTELITPRTALGSRLLDDSAIRQNFARELRLLAAQLGVDDLPGEPYEALQAEQAETLLRLQAQAPFTRAVSLKALVERLSTLANIDPTSDTWFVRSFARGAPALPRVVTAYAGDDAEGSFLDLHNLLPVPVSITTLRHGEAERADEQAPPVTLASRVTFPIRLAPTAAGQPQRPVRVRYRQPKVAAVPETIHGVARIAGDPRKHLFTARESPGALDRHPVPTATLNEALERHPFLSRVPNEFALRIQPGRFAVEGSLVMPPGTGLVIGAGTELVFGSRSGLITSGPLDLLGTAEEPIILRGTPKRRGAPWGGIAMLGARRESTWSHAAILGAEGIERPGWRLPASVTIRRAPVRMQSVEITAPGADAALAVIETTLHAEKLALSDTAGTALTIQGTDAFVSDLRVEGAGRNGIEARGARVELTGGTLRQIHATAIEATHGATLSATGLIISDASIAATAKNGSTVSLDGVEVREIAHVPFLAFTDRPEMGGGEIRATGGSVGSTPRIAIAQTGSRVAIDGEETPPVDAAIGDLHID
jgi:hypothetical protein